MASSNSSTGVLCLLHFLIAFPSSCLAPVFPSSIDSAFSALNRYSVKDLEETKIDSGIGVGCKTFEAKSSRGRKIPAVEERFAKPYSSRNT